MHTTSTPTTFAHTHSHTLTHSIPIEDPQAAVLTKKVLDVAAAMASLSVLGIVLRWASYGSCYSAALPLVSVALALVVPACGYIGARDRRRDLLMWFVGCNACHVVLVVLNILSAYTWNEREYEVCTYGDSGFLKVVSLLVIAGSAILAFLGCTWGRELMDSSYITVVYASTPGVPSAPVYQQPGPGYGGGGGGGGYGAVGSTPSYA